MGGTAVHKKVLEVGEGGILMASVMTPKQRVGLEESGTNFSLSDAPDLMTI